MNEDVYIIMLCIFHLVESDILIFIFIFILCQSY